MKEKEKRNIGKKVENEGGRKRKRRSERGKGTVKGSRMNEKRMKKDLIKMR